ncbi:hypothetical protein BP6252_06659 [Coleophoma cylindrospora]|uniref:Uncharacterized protein n=1 Tax=Coleophoma cylindrospora TaxID=1849047 RepID=A0A3D8RN74_9HELO|nr:hypothetical protein BP6252_06659 [Coleophoma cylindrospora]
MADRHGSNDVPLLDYGGRGKSQEPSSSTTTGDGPRDGSFDQYGLPIKMEKRKTRTSILKNLKGRRHALVKSLLHLPSVAISLGVLSLTFRRVFWEPPSSNTNAVLNALQFAAQLHGSLIMMSLSAMLLHLVHHDLSGKRGVPLGFLSSSFQLNSISYLFGKEFTSMNFRYIVIFLSAFALAMLSGPSSAITMIPRLQFWSIDKLWLNKGHVDFHVYIAANETSLYPVTLTADDSPPQCLESNASMLSQCPSYGARKWLLDTGLFSGWENGQPTINTTIEESWIRYVVGTASMVNVGTQSVYLTSTLSNFLGRALFAYDDHLQNVRATNLGIYGSTTLQSEEDSNLLARYDLSFRAAGKEIATRKPLVEIECAGYPSNSTSLSFLHNTMVWPPWQEEPIFSTEWSVSTSDYANLSMDLNSTIVNSSWVDIAQFDGIKPSLAAIFTTPETVYQSGYHKYSNQSFYTCTIDARWMPTKVFTDASSGKAAVFDFFPDPNGPILAELDNGPVPDSMPSLYIAESWTKLLDVPWMDSVAFPVPTNRSILDTIGQKCLEQTSFLNVSILGTSFNDSLPRRVTTSPMNMPQCLQVSLSVFLTDALARVQDAIPTYFVMEGHVQSQYPSIPSDIFLVQDLYNDYAVQSASVYGRVMNISQADFLDPSKFTEMYMPASRWGYGYGFQSSNLVIFGATIILLHVVLCVVYIAWTLGAGEYRSAGWDSIGELVWMAMRSGLTRDDFSGVDALKKKESLKKRWLDRFCVRDIETSAGDKHDNHSGMDGNTMVFRRVTSRVDD